MRRNSFTSVCIMLSLGISICLIGHNSKQKVTTDNSQYSAEIKEHDNINSIKTQTITTLTIPSLPVEISLYTMEDESVQVDKSIIETITSDIQESETPVKSNESTTENNTDTITEKIAEPEDTSVSDHTDLLQNDILKPENRWGVSLTESEKDLLARIVWAESRGECTEGQIAVAEVVLNRMYSDKFPDTLQDVLSQKNQFASWKLRDTAKNYDKQVEIVEMVLAGKTDTVPLNVLYFATSPLGDDVVKIIGNHYFTSDYTKK